MFITHDTNMTTKGFEPEILSMSRDLWCVCIYVRFYSKLKFLNIAELQYGK